MVFPFKDEDPAIVGANLKTAAAHDGVTEVWAVAATDSSQTAAVTALSEEIAASWGKPVLVLAQERIGRCPPRQG